MWSDGFFSGAMGWGDGFFVERRAFLWGDGLFSGAMGFLVERWVLWRRWVHLIVQELRVRDRVANRIIKIYIYVLAFA